MKSKLQIKLVDSYVRALGAVQDRPVHGNKAKVTLAILVRASSLTLQPHGK
jgi:hypothetical protein